MLTKKIKSKKVICSLFMCIALLISAFCGLKMPDEKVFAISANYRENISSEALSSYYNFSTSSSAKPATANGWTVLDDYATNDDAIVRGIVDLSSESTFPESTYKTERPIMPKSESSDKNYFKNLMINSYSGKNRLGYKSSSITLDQDSFYSIEVKLYTHRTATTDPTASIYLTGLVKDDHKNEDYGNEVKFENINTLKSWSTYKFFIATNESATINLELWLGNKSTGVEGAVFFNNVTIYRYSEDYFVENILEDEKINSEDNFKNNIIDLTSQNETQPVNNSSFETTAPLQWDPLDGYKNTYQIVDANKFNLVNSDVKITAPGSNCSPNNNHALFMYNKNDSYQGLESSEFTIEQLSYYKLTFWAKSNCGEGDGAVVKLVDKTEDDPIADATLKLSTTFTSGSNKYRNDWTKYTFFIYGDALEDKTVSIQIWLGTKDDKTNGYVFIDDFRIDTIDYNTYSKSSSSTNATTFNFNNETDEFVISNNNFNKTENEDTDKTYPLKPTGWKVSGNYDKANTFSGVVNTDADHFNSNIDSYRNTNTSSRKPTRPNALPYTENENNNVLMIGSSVADGMKQEYTSNELTLNADSYYKLTYYIFTDYAKNDKNNKGARVQLRSGSRTLFDYYNIHFNDNNWHKFEVYIKVGANQETATLSLFLEEVAGYVYFDEIMLLTSSEDTFKNYYKDPQITQIKVDLSRENFDNRTYNFVGDIQSPNNWTGSEQDSKEITNSGTVNLDNTALLGVVGNTISGNKTALYISSLHDVYYTFTSKQTYKFTAQTYYKITVNVLTQNIQSDNEQDDINYGASIGLDTNNDIYFSEINTKGAWETYTIYLCLENDLTAAPTLSLGFKDEATCGEVLFDDLAISTIDKETYEAETTEKDDSNFKAFINYSEPEETEEEETEWTNKFEDWWIIPSLLTGLAIIISVVGFYFKRINFKKKPKVKTKYDRRKTLDKDIDRREKIALRKQIIAELNEELLAIDKEMEEYSKAAEKELATLKEKLIAEQEELKRKKLDIEIKKKEATAEREKQLKENPDLATNTKAEREFSNYIAKLDKSELSIQKQITAKDVRIASTAELDKSKLAKFLERKEYIKNEILKIEAEIEEIAKEDASVWEEYKSAKANAKKQKQEYKQSIKTEKSFKKKENPTTKKSPAEKSKKTTKTSDKEDKQ